MKQRIDHSNYEAWLLDRLEGNLGAEQEAELRAFLLLHPHLDPGHEELPTIIHAASKLGSLDKEALKRRLPPVAKVDGGNIDDHLIARLENDLSREQLEALRIFVEHHPEHQRAEHLFALTKLVPEAMAFAAKADVHRALPPKGMPTRFTLDDFLVARLEGELTQAQELALARFIAQEPSAQRAWSLMQATRVRASDTFYDHKDGLKKGGRVIAITHASWAVRLAAAASVLVLLGLAGWWWARTHHGVQVAEEELRTAPVQEPRNAQQEKASAQDAPIERPKQPDARREEPLRSVPGSNKERPRAEGRPAKLPDPPPALIEAPISSPQQENKQEPPAPMIEPLPVKQDEPLLASAPRLSAKHGQEPNTLGQALAATLRERVLDSAGDAARPLDENDAFAAVDRGLKAIGGQRTGLDVTRDAAGRNRSFNLRLGRNLAISASR